MSQIGEYLRARRELVRPEDVGIADNGRRRVPGLRRDELAMLAGISTEYYTRLEQGRDHHPSPQVLDAVARALGLDDDAALHLHALAGPPPRPRRRTERVTPSLQQLLDTMGSTPAYVQGARMDVLASNALARALSPMWTPGVNIVRAVFLDPSVRRLFVDWERRIGNSVAALRALAGPGVDDPELNELVGELSVRSAEFRRLWARHDVKPQVGGGSHRFCHPQVGDLELLYDKFQVAGTDQMLVVYHAEPGTRSEQALALLGVTAAGTPAPRS